MQCLQITSENIQIWKEMLMIKPLLLNLNEFRSSLPAAV